jgi:hypothetical protein
MGKSTHSTLGWQRFRLLDSDVIAKSQADYASDNSLTSRNAVLSSVVENATTTVATYNKQHGNTANKSPMETGDIYAKPLRDAEGRLLTFSDPFALRLRLELINMTGDSTGTTSGTTKPKPQVLIGVCANATNFQASTNKHATFGWRNKRDDGGSELVDETPVWLTCHTDNDGDGWTLVNTANSYNDGTNIFEGTLFFGPDTDIGNNSSIMAQAYHDAGEDFIKANVGYQHLKLDDADNNLGTGQVYLLIALADCNATDNSGGNDCVFTFRYSYMVDGDPVNGWGTS